MLKSLEKKLQTIQNEAKALELALESKKEQYGDVIKHIASHSDTSSTRLANIYDLHQTYYEEVDDEGDMRQVYYLYYGLADELSKNINTPENILFEIAECEAYSHYTSNNAEATITKQSLLIAKNLKSTTEELNKVRLWSNDTYIALAKHPNTGG